MRPIRSFAPLFALMVAAACHAKPPPPRPSGPAGHMEHAMAHCPSAVPGSATVMHQVDGGVVLEITAADPIAAREITDRAHLYATAGAPSPYVAPHTGMHGGPGDVGHCPVIHHGTKVSVEDIGGGARITVLAEDPKAADALLRDTRDRVQWLHTNNP